MIIWNWKMVLIALIEEHGEMILQLIGLGLLFFGLAMIHSGAGVCQ